MAFWHRAHSDKCYFQLLIPGLTPVSLLESNLGFLKLSRNLHTPKNGSLHIHSLWYWLWPFCWVFGQWVVQSWITFVFWSGSEKRWHRPRVSPPSPGSARGAGYGQLPRNRREEERAAVHAEWGAEAEDAARVDGEAPTQPRFRGVEAEGGRPSGCQFGEGSASCPPGSRDEGSARQGVWDQTEGWAGVEQEKVWYDSKTGNYILFSLFLPFLIILSCSISLSNFVIKTIIFILVISFCHWILSNSSNRIIAKSLWSTEFWPFHLV